VLIVMIFSILLYLNPVPFQRFRGMFETSSLTNEQLFKEHHRSTESNVVRRMIWTVSGEIISDNPFGVGSGDANTELLKKYRQYDMTGALSKELNAHNQFIQTTLALGYPGLLLLIALFIFPLLNSFKNKNYLLFIFLVITTINVAVESMFETESGIVFIILFYCFLLSEKEKITKFNS
ncbi:MAG: O-antigen ligase family protein, partial [Bacteroidota bacterium]